MTKSTLTYYSVTIAVISIICFKQSNFPVFVLEMWLG